MFNIKKIISYVVLIAGLLFSIPFFANAQVNPPYTVPQGGTGASTLTGCLQGNGKLPITGSGLPCGSGGGGSGGGTWSTTTSSVAGRLLNYSNNTTDIVIIGGTSTSTAKVIFDPNTQINYFKGSVGIGTTSPYSTLSVAGQIVGQNFVGTSTATSSFAGPVLIATTTDPETYINATPGFSYLNGTKVAVGTGMYVNGTINVNSDGSGHGFFGTNELGRPCDCGFWFNPFHDDAGGQQNGEVQIDSPNSISLNEGLNGNQRGIIQIGRSANSQGIILFQYNAPATALDPYEQGHKIVLATQWWNGSATQGYYMAERLRASSTGQGTFGVLTWYDNDPGGGGATNNTATGTPFLSWSIKGVVSNNFTSTSSIVASIFPLASTTDLSVSHLASTTNLVISALGKPSGQYLATDRQGNVIGTTTPTGGGSTTIIAGTNVTISEGSPCSSSCTINTSGGSGTNYFTSSGVSINQNTGSIVQGGTFTATSTTQASVLPIINSDLINTGNGSDQWLKHNTSPSEQVHIGSDLGVAIDINYSGSPVAFDFDNASSPAELGQNYIDDGAGNMDIGGKLRLGQSHRNDVGPAGDGGIESYTGDIIVDVGKIGIGSTTPYAQLSVSNLGIGNANPLVVVASSTNGVLATSTYFIVNKNGNVGIASSSPESKLTVNGTISTNGQITSYVTTGVGAPALLLPLGSINAPAIAFKGGPSFGGLWADSGNIYIQVAAGNTIGFSSSGTVSATSFSGNSVIVGSGSAGTPSVNLGGDFKNGLFRVNSDDIGFAVNGLEVGRFINGGNLGIGTSTPYAKLSVVGQTVSQYFTATSTSNSSTFPNASTTALTVGGSLYLPGSDGCLQLTSGLVSSTGSACGGGAGTNYFTSSGITISQNTGSIVQGGSFIATSTTATSTFAGNISSSGTNLVFNIASAISGATSQNINIFTPAGGSQTGSLNLYTANAIAPGNVNISGGNSNNASSGNVNITAGGGYAGGTVSITSGIGTNGNGVILFNVGNSNFIGISTSTPSVSLDVNGGIYSETASTTSFTYNFCTSNNSQNFWATSTNSTIYYTNATRQCLGKTNTLNITAPLTGLIGSTTISSNTAGVNVVWDGGLFSGNSVINGSTDRFVCTLMATSTVFIACDYTGTF